MSTDVSELRVTSIIRAIARTFETSVDIQLRTRQHIPEDFELHTGKMIFFSSSVGATVHCEPWHLPRLLSIGPDPAYFVSNF
jgi:hypothetical protein